MISTEQSVKGKLLLASTASLYVELLMIRWIPNTVHIIGFFNNLILIACFLGIGLGIARPIPLPAAVNRSFVRLVLLVLVLILLNYLNVVVVLQENRDYAVNEFQAVQGFPIALIPVLAGIFCLSVYATIPYGQLVSAFFDRLPPLQAYSVNILGSLFGVVLFAALSWAQMPPLIWFLGLICLLLFLHRSKFHLIAVLMIVAALQSVTFRDSSRPGTIVKWSPYYKVIARPLSPLADRLDDGFTIRVNDQFLLSGFNLNPTAKSPAGLPESYALQFQALRSYYDFPFSVRKPERVLVLGSGAGNDVAAALRRDANHVIAVELDPTVIEIGKLHHPEHPYSSERVTLLQEDARAFLRRTKEKFDLIIFATLDAHGLLSSVGNVRLDSFVYTEESFAEAKSHLMPDGILVLSFGPFREDVQYRQLSTLRGVFGHMPLYFEHSNRHRTMIAGNVTGLQIHPLSADWREIGSGEIEAKLRQYPYAARPATDDWPHLYIREPRIPREYWGILGFILISSAAFVTLNFGGWKRMKGHFFFLGSAFLLLETKSVTEFALLMGSTWQVNAVVFVAILVTILLANLLASSFMKWVRVPILYVLLFLGLLGAYFFPISVWANPGSTIDVVLASSYLAFPILLAGLIFAASFRETEVPSIALASNLLGAVLGGTTEYLSLTFGIRALSLLAAAFYCASFLFWFRNRSLR